MVMLQTVNKVIKYILVLFVVLALILIGKNLLIYNTSTTLYKLNYKTYRLLIADSEEKREKGLMDYKKLTGVDGMIFIFPDKELRSFWNKNTYLNLDVYWLDDDKIVGKSFLPSIEKSKNIIIVSSSSPVNKVIELVSY